jgi:hypothetical protein
MSRDHEGLRRLNRIAADVAGLRAGELPGPRESTVRALDSMLPARLQPEPKSTKSSGRSSSCHRSLRGGPPAANACEIWQPRQPRAPHLANGKIGTATTVATLEYIENVRSTRYL